MPHDPWLGWSNPALPSAAERLVSAYTRSGVADLRGAVVVVPGGRAGRRLKELLVEAASDADVRLVPPEVVTAGRLPELLFEPPRPTADGATLRLAWMRALREASADRLTRVWSRVEELDTADGWAALARDLAALHREVAAGGLRFSDVATVCGDPSAGLSGDDSPRWRILADLQDAYAGILDGVGLADPDLARIEALEAGRIRTDRDVWLVCVPELPSVALAMLDAVADRVRPLVHAPAGEEERFERFGTVEPEAWAAVHLGLDEAALHVVDGPAEQAATVARVLAAHAHDHAAEDVAVAVPDGELTPWLAETLGGLGVQVRAAEGRKIEDTAPWRALTVVADFLEGRRYDRFAALVRHPDVERWLGASLQDDAGARKGGWLGALDRWYQTHLPATMPDPGGRPTARRDARDARVVKDLLDRVDGALLGGMHAAPDRRPIGEWVPDLLGILGELYGAARLERANRAHRRLARALQILGDAARAFEAVPEELDVPVASATAIRLVLQEAAGSKIPSAPEHDAIELMGWLEIHPDDARLRIVTGVNEPFLPRAVRGDAFLPDALRARLGLVDEATRYARDLYRLRSMVEGDGRVVLVTARRTGRGDPLRPSRLLFAADPETVARRIRRIVDGGGEDAHGEGASDVGAAADTAVASDVAAPEPAVSVNERTSRFPVPPVREIERGRRITTLSVTDFGSLIADPYRFALGKYLRAEAVRDDAREMDPLQFGTFAHAVLQAFGRDEARDSDDVERIRARLDHHLDTLFRERYVSRRQRPHVSVQLQTEQLRARMHAFARVHADRVREGWRVVGVERGAGEEGVRFAVDGADVRIRGTMDRIERHVESGRWAVFDYKTGGTAKRPEKVHRKRDRWVDLQLPLYRWLLPRLPSNGDAGPLPDPDAPVEVGYIVLPRDVTKAAALVAPWTEPEIEDALEAGRQAIRDAWASGFVWDPDRRPRFEDEEVERVLGRGVLTAAPPAVQPGGVAR